MDLMKTIEKVLASMLQALSVLLYAPLLAPLLPISYPYFSSITITLPSPSLFAAHRAGLPPREPLPSFVCLQTGENPNVKVRITPVTNNGVHQSQNLFMFITSSSFSYLRSLAPRAD